MSLEQLQTTCPLPETVRASIRVHRRQPPIESRGLTNSASRSRDDCHRIFLSIQAVSRGEQGLISRRAVPGMPHNGDQLLTRLGVPMSSLSAIIFLGDGAAAQRHQHDSDFRLRQSLVNFAKELAVPRPMSFSLNQTVGDTADWRSCCSLAPLPGHPTHGRGRSPDLQATALIFRRFRGSA